MIKVEVNLLGPFMEYGDKRRYDYVLKDGATFIDLLELMATELGTRFQYEVVKNIHSLPLLRRLIFINNKQITEMEGVYTCLADGDKVSFLAPVEGG